MGLVTARGLWNDTTTDHSGKKLNMCSDISGRD
jgi:hypothetical protein